MGSVVVLGEPGRTDGFALAGAAVMHVDDTASLAAACQHLPDDVSVVVLTPGASSLGAEALLPGDVLSVVMPPVVVSSDPADP